jgi:hypothetical protein
MVERDHWRVVVSINGEEVLAIEPEMLAGIPDIDKYDDAIRTAAMHLISFIGPEEPEPFFIDDDLASPSPEGKDP